MKKDSFLYRMFSITKGKSIYGVYYGLASLVAGVVVLYPLDFNYELAIKSASPGAEHWLRASLLVLIFAVLSRFVYSKGFHNTAKTIGSLAGLILLYPALGLLAGLPKGLDLLGVLLLLNGTMTVLISFSSLVTVLLLSKLGGKKC